MPNNKEHPVSQQVVDYTMPFYKDNGIAIMMRKPKQATVFLWFLTILDHHIWLNFAAGFLLTSILIYLFERCSPIAYRNPPENYGNESRYTKLTECFWFCLTSIAPHDCGAMPKNLSGKLAAAVWWLFVFVIVAVYNANLTAYQTLYRLERHIETIDDLRRQNQVEYTTVINSSAYRYFKSLRDSEKILSKWVMRLLPHGINDSIIKHPYRTRRTITTKPTVGHSILSVLSTHFLKIPIMALHQYCKFESYYWSNTGPINCIFLYMGRAIKSWHVANNWSCRESLRMQQRAIMIWWEVTWVEAKTELKVGKQIMRFFITRGRINMPR